VVEQIHDHQNNVAVGSLPLLVIDAWEHAYYLQYENRRTDWVENIWKVLDWPAVQARFERSREFSLQEAALPESVCLSGRESSHGVAEGGR
jgi:Fe-Mn family superoxide dismutase